MIQLENLISGSDASADVVESQAENVKSFFSSLEGLSLNARKSVNTGTIAAVFVEE